MCQWIHIVLILQVLVPCIFGHELTHRGRYNMAAIFQTTLHFLNKNVWILITISLKLVSKGPNDNIPALVQIMAWRRPGDKPLSEAMVVRLPTHICVTRPQWVKDYKPSTRTVLVIKLDIVSSKSICLQWFHVKFPYRVMPCKMADEISRNPAVQMELSIMTAN